MFVIGALIVIVAEAVFVVSVAEVAVTVTVAGFGGVEGAVYVVAVPLGEDADEKVPHDELLHVTVHLTPALLLSFLTTAVRLASPPATTDAHAARLPPHPT